MIDAEILLDSVNPVGCRITTWKLTFNRFILSEFNTHRKISRNSASSRAIPSNLMIKAINDNPALPIHWGKLQKGMQADEELSEKEKTDALEIWLEARDNAVESVQKLLQIGLHKQVANRLLEPWMHQIVLMTATDMDNFFALRAEEHAQPEFRKLAYQMLDLYNANPPKRLAAGEWHIPFSDKYCDGLSITDKLKVCTARAARVSYKNFEGEIDHQKDFDLHDRLISQGHVSPTEHAARALSDNSCSGNFTGWLQYRKLLTGENRIDPRVKKYYEEAN